MENTDFKRKQILEAAAKRFAHFGLSKTTMNDIAKDLSFSKGLLYYYFSNKDELYIGVFIDVVAKMSEEIDKGVRKQPTVEKALLYYLEKRQDFIIRYYKLLIQPPRSRQTQSPELKQVYRNTLEIEVRRIKEVFERGCERGEISIDDPAHIANLFLAAVSGLRFSSFQASPPSSFPELEKLQEIFFQQKQLASIFCRGLLSSNVR